MCKSVSLIITPDAIWHSFSEMPTHSIKSEFIFNDGHSARGRLDIFPDGCYSIIISNAIIKQELVSKWRFDINSIDYISF